MSIRQKAINSAVRKTQRNKHYTKQRLKDIYPRRTAKNYTLYIPKKFKTKKWVEPATHLGPLIPLGKNKPVGKNITLADIYNKHQNKRNKKNQLPELVRLSTKERLINKPSRKY